MKRLFLKSLFASVLLLIGLFVLNRPVFAVNDVNVYFFWGDGCPHCAKEKPFLEKLENKYTSLKVFKYEVWKSNINRKLLVNVGEVLNEDISGVPFTVIGEKTVSGYLNDETTGKEIEDAVKYCLENSCNDPVSRVVSITSDINKSAKDKLDNTNSKVNNKSFQKAIPEILHLPFMGDVKTKDVSLPVLTVMIAILDGFNPCAMWTLLFLVSLLIGMHDKKRMWILGSAFIISSAVIYFMFMAAWLHLILFIGFIFWIRLAIGMLSMTAGMYNLREYFTNKDNACKVTRGKERRRVFDAIKSFTKEKHFLLALLGIIILAAAVNVVELICSAGLPVIYTQILSLSNLSIGQYYLYLLLYIFIFMLDDLFVFIISIKTLELTGVTTKYSRLSHFVGGIIMLAIGLILIFKPELLMFD